MDQLAVSNNDHASLFGLYSLVVGLLIHLNRKAYFLGSGFAGPVCVPISCWEFHCCWPEDGLRQLAVECGAWVRAWVLFGMAIATSSRYAGIAMALPY